jgi:hypothetical protein
MDHKERTISVIQGCLAFLARKSTLKEEVLLSFTINKILEALKAVNRNEPCLQEYEIIVSAPIMIYSLRVHKGNEVQSAKALGISRYGLSRRKKAMSKYPAIRQLIRDMGCAEYFPILKVEPQIIEMKSVIVRENNYVIS